MALESTSSRLGALTYDARAAARSAVFRSGAVRIGGRLPTAIDEFPLRGRAGCTSRTSRDELTDAVGDLGRI